MATCETCKNEVAYRIQYTFREKKLTQVCDRCGNLSVSFNPDVFFKEPYWDENIVDEKDSSTWNNGTFVGSRSEKARLMRKYNLYESGDRIHGSRNFEKRRKYV